MWMCVCVYVLKGKGQGQHVVRSRLRVFSCVLPSPLPSARLSSLLRGSVEKGEYKMEERGKKSVEEKTDYLGRLGELLTVLLLNLLQPAVGLQQEGRGECEKEICRQTDRGTKKGSCEIESSVRKCTCHPPNLHMHTRTHSR